MMITTAVSLVMMMLSADGLGVIKSPTARGASGGMMTAIATGGTEITVVRAGGITTGATEITTAVPPMGALLIAIAVRATEPGATGTGVEITLARDGMIGITTVATAATTEADWTTRMIAGHRSFRRLHRPYYRFFYRPYMGYRVRYGCYSARYGYRSGLVYGPRRF
jgi:hypothetical protein